MLARIGSVTSRVFEKSAPDPFVLAILLTGVTAALCLVFGEFGGEPRVGALLDSWAGERGLWRFLGFGMQMCLVLVSGHALASSRPMRSAVRTLTAIPRGPGSAVVLVAFVAMLAGLVNWGLGLIIGALLARDMARELGRRGIAVHAPLLAAAGYAGMMVWHGGLSGSAPLTMTMPEGAARVLPESALALMPGGIPLGETILSPLNLAVSGGLVLLMPVVFALMTPRDGVIAAAPSSDGDMTARREQAGGADDASSWLVRTLERSPLLAWALALALLAVVVRYVLYRGLGRIGLNEVNAAMIALGLLLHASPARYAAAIEDAARGCAGVIIQFPLYAGIMGMLVSAGLIERFSGAVAETFSGDGLVLATAASAAAVNLFVPSGGGQWGIQGPIALEAGLAAGVEPARMVMAVAYGDQLTNMLQPFWALPLLAITGCRAREIVGYTAVAMVAAAAWVGVCLLVL